MRRSGATFRPPPATAQSFRKLLKTLSFLIITF
jgi:hypothetical protein